MYPILEYLIARSFFLKEIEPEIIIQKDSKKGKEEPDHCIKKANLPQDVKGLIGIIPDI
jgi:hypothetical protein